jgi:hypothetical protein
MLQSQLRKTRTEIALTASAGLAPAVLPPGEWFMEQQAAVVKVFDDPQGSRCVANVSVVDFLDGLATRQIVFVSWG